MVTRSIGTALVLSAAAMALSAGSCSSGGGGDGDDFFVQTWSEAAPNTSLAQFFDEGDNGDKISLTQHTGRMTVGFEGEDIEDIPEGAVTLEATVDGEDENPMHLELDDSLDFPKVSVDSAGTFDNLEVEVMDEGTADERLGVIGLKTDDPDVGDDILALLATSPGQFEVRNGPLDYMSIVSWIITEIPDLDDTSLTLEFGYGHLGLVTPEDDMPTEGVAHYDGNFEGVYAVPGADEEGFIGDATGLADFTADFGEGVVDGGVHGITVVGSDVEGNIDFVDVTIGGGLADGFDRGSIAGNTFSGNVVPGDEGFAGFDGASTGTVDGTFYGPVNEDLNGPEEAGAVLTLQDAASDTFITGVIGANVAFD